MTIERADRLKAPPVLGRFYLVPCVLWAWGCYGGKQWWPVLGHKHTDVEHFNFTWPHYHVDPRFLTKAHWSRVGTDDPACTALDILQACPLSNTKLPDGPPKPVWRKLRCSMVEISYEHAHRGIVLDLNRHFQGQQCHKGKRGFVCPHKHIALGSIAPIDGVITCPLHGLRIEAATGIVLPATPGRQT